MTKNELSELKEFTNNTSVEKLKKFLQGLDLMNSDQLNSNLPNEFTEAEIEQLVFLRDVEQWFRLFADFKIEKGELEAENKDRIRRNVPLGRWL